MILAGWECCDKWESAAKTGGEPWDASDEKVAAASMASEARLPAKPPLRDRISDRQRQRAAGGDLEDVC